ncbi:MAG: ATP-dependent metallopeptidase FtsH/Yme1/Tma family protein, partial [Planctomycetota bacterium]
MNDSQDKKPSLPHRDQQNKSGKRPPLPRYKRSPFTYVIVIIALLTMMLTMRSWTQADPIDWDDFTAHVDANEIASITINETEISGKFNEKGMESRRDMSKKRGPSESFTVDYNPQWLGEQWLGKLEESGIEVKFGRQHIWLSMLIQLVLPLLMVIALFYFFFARNLSRGAGGM